MYLIWSNEHRQWWRPNSMGYTSNISEAGLYSQGAMREIIKGATLDWHQAPNELPVRAIDLPDEAKLKINSRVEFSVT